MPRSDEISRTKYWWRFLWPFFGLVYSVWSGLVWSGLVNPSLVFLLKLRNYSSDLAEILCVKYSAQNLIEHKISARSDE